MNDEALRETVGHKMQWRIMTNERRVDAGREELHCGQSAGSSPVPDR